MADPARVPDPRYTDPLHPAGVDPAADARLNPANTDDPRVLNRVEQKSSGGTAIMVAAVVLALAIIAYFLFAPGSQTPVAPTEPAVISEPATPATPPAPDATAPATPAPDTTAPAGTAPAVPESTAPAAPESSAPAAPTETAPAAPATPAPAQ